MLDEEYSETFVTYSIKLSKTIEIHVTPICVLVHRDSYLNVVRNNISGETCTGIIERTVPRAKQNAEPGNLPGNI